MKNSRNLQKGFSLIELGVVLVIISILGLYLVPRFNAYLIGGRVDPTVKDVTAVVNAMRGAAAATGGNTPYTSLGATAAATAVFANTARDRASALTVAGAGATATVQHQLGATGSEIAVAQATITAAGDAFSVTFPTTSKSACPGLATQLSKSVEVITINGTNVKAAGGAYNGGAAENACTAGDTNTFVFTIR